MVKRKKKRMRLFFVLFCLVILSVYGGVKIGEFLAYKLSKPIDEKSSPLQNVKNDANAGKSQILSESEMLSLTSKTSEFVSAEHLKKADKLAELVSPDYYNTLTKNIRSLSTGEVSVQNLNFKDISKDNVKIEVTYIKNSKKGSETITFKVSDGIWKVVNVER